MVKSKSGSKFKSVKNISKNLSEYTDMANNTVGSFSEGFLKSFMETSNIAELILNCVNNLIYGIGKNISVLSHTIIKNIGVSIETIANMLGGFAKKIPLVGEQTAFLIEKGGSAIKYVIVPIADLVSLTTDVALDATESLKDVLVFTVNSGKKVSSKALKNAQKAVEKLSSTGTQTISNVVDETLVSGIKKSLKKLKLS